MIHETIEYQHNGNKFIGYLSFSENQEGKRPAVIVAHAWRGQDAFARKKADEMAEAGYIGFAIDMYGEGKQTTDPNEAYQLMVPLFLDRKLVRDRVGAALKALSSHPLVETDAIGAIGFCFGGMTVIELLRSGAPVRGVVSFHGLLGWKFGTLSAPLVPNAQAIKGKILILHGYLDPLVPPADVPAIQKELADAGVDWEMDIYGQGVHAFTNPEASDEKGGVCYNPVIAGRAKSAMLRFFKELFSR